jgi:hypothetical protein
MDLLRMALLHICMNWRDIFASLLVDQRWEVLSLAFARTPEEESDPSGEEQSNSMFPARNVV